MSGFIDGSKIDSDFTGEFDVSVVGSGPSGSLVALLCKRGGLKTCLIEEGGLAGYRDYGEFNLFRYQDYGVRIITGDVTLRVFQARMAGGGVNYATLFDEPYPFILDEWRKRFDIKWAGNKEWIDKGFGRLNRWFKFVDADEIEQNGNNVLFKDVIEAAGFTLRKKRGFINTACIKDKSSINPIIDEFLSMGGSFLVNAMVKRLIHNGWQVQGLDGNFLDNEHKFSKRFFRIKSKVICLCCGSINTSLLLKSSDYPDRNKRVGSNIFLNPSVPVIALFNKDLRAFKGLISAYYSDELFNKYGIILEPDYLSPIFLMRLLNLSGDKGLNLFRRLNNLSIFALRIRDSNCYCEIKKGWLSDRVMEYRFNNGLIDIIRNTLEKIRSALKKYGAIEIFLPEESKDLLKTFYSIAPQGGMLMGSDPSVSVLRLTGETYSLRNLFVADASGFPSPTGFSGLTFGILWASHIAENILKLSTSL